MLPKQRADQQGVAAASSCDTAFQSGQLDHTGQEKSSADRCGPPSVRPPVLVILLVEHGGYLFLHQPQLIAQVVVGFQKVLDLGFRSRERRLHLHVLMDSNRPVGELRVLALLDRGVKSKAVKAPIMTVRGSERQSLSGFGHLCGASIPLSCLRGSKGARDRCPHQTPRCRSQAGRFPGCHCKACRPHSSG